MDKKQSRPAQKAGAALGNERSRQLEKSRYRSLLHRTYLGRAALGGIKEGERIGLISRLYGSDNPVDDVRVSVSPFYVRLECAVVIVVAPLLDLQPCAAVVGDVARSRLLVVDVERNEVADPHPIAIAVAVDLDRVRWRRQGQQT